MNFVSTSVLHLLHNRQTHDRKYAVYCIQGTILSGITPKKYVQGFHSLYLNKFQEYIKITEILQNSLINNRKLLLCQYIKQIND